MSRNRYAVILLVVLALTLWLAGRYVNRPTATLCNELQTACTLAETGQMPQAQQAYRAAADNAGQQGAGDAGAAQSHRPDEPDLKPAARLC